MKISQEQYYLLSQMSSSLDLFEFGSFLRSIYTVVLINDNRKTLLSWSVKNTQIVFAGIDPKIDPFKPLEDAQIQSRKPVKFCMEIQLIQPHFNLSLKILIWSLFGLFRKVIETIEISVILEYSVDLFLFHLMSVVTWL